MRLLIGVILSALCWPALAQDGHHGRGHDKWHSEFYSKLMRPDTGKKFDSCCNLKDCSPTVSRSSPFGYCRKADGYLELRYRCCANGILGIHHHCVGDSMTPSRIVAAAMILTWPLWGAALAFASVPRALAWGALMPFGIWLDLTQPDLPSEGDL